MLNAPMPYFCGISRENFQHAAADINDETIVVDLDMNLISLGPDTPELPPIPHKAKIRLEASLKKNAGHVFWNARGISQDAVTQLRHNSDSSKEIHNNAKALWSERIQTIDDAFSLAPAPESTSILHDRDGILPAQSRWDAVQEAFLSFFVTALKSYRKFMPGSRVRVSWLALDRSKQFKSGEFISSQRSDFKPFLGALVLTQAFEDFITRRMDSPGEPDVIFFDKAIEARKNNTILKKKRDTSSFLHSANAHKELHKYTAVLPNQKDIPRSEFAAVGSHGHRVFVYPSWPETFDVSMFCAPRPFPKDIAAVVNRTITLSGGRSFVVPRDPFREYHEGN